LLDIHELSDVEEYHIANNELHQRQIQETRGDLQLFEEELRQEEFYIRQHFQVLLFCFCFIEFYFNNLMYRN
jgi:hypothetical protein